MNNRDPLLAYLIWFVRQQDAFRFDTEDDSARSTRSAVVIPFRR